MARNKILAALVLLPISKIYGLVASVRNKLFDANILKQHTFDIPVVVVGNISMGGTGKTPHTEYIIDLLQDRYKLGVLSRGYRRSTKGFVLAGRRSRPEDIGDEPYQIFQKYGGAVTVAVDESRVDGINQLLDINPDINLMVLDDAFQHRYVKPSIAVVLMEYNRPPFYDSYLPYGRLRENMNALLRADIVIVTKCPDEMKPMEVRIFKESLNLFPYQKLFFSKYAYGHLVPVFPESSRNVPFLDMLSPDDTLMVVTGVANPRPFVRHLRRYPAQVKALKFPDHHFFNHNDMELISKRYNELEGRNKYIITTEKDAVRLVNNPYFPHALKPYIYYIPIKVEFIPERGETVSTFDESIGTLIDDWIKKHS